MSSSREPWDVGLGRYMDCRPAVRARRLRETPHKFGNSASFMNTDISPFRF